tara:strand:+ start:7928 stop:8086 length:159 start_codon:yes stop_codon:yes gene_type:complete
MKKIHYFNAPLNRINEGLEKRELTADDVVSIMNFNSKSKATTVVVFYKDKTI